ncbi:MAG: hypothetical protein QNK19_01530, partial [Xanthomonadales bacterium]|nr:hypothetical protein [Xanthomonadales bacterium]
CEGQWFLIDARRLILSWGYVQDERYVAGAWMRRSDVCQFCTAHEEITECRTRAFSGGYW